MIAASSLTSVTSPLSIGTVVVAIVVGITIIIILYIVKISHLRLPTFPENPIVDIPVIRRVSQIPLQPIAVESNLGPWWRQCRPLDGTQANQRRGDVVVH